MTYAIPLFWVGRYWTNAIITPLTINALTGVASRGTSYDLATGTVVESVRFNQTARGENIKGANSIVDNYQLIADDFEVEVGEVKANSGSGLTLNGWVGFDHFLVEVGVSPDGGTHNYMVQAPCVRAGMDDPYEEGKAVMTLRGRACGLPIAYIPLTNGAVTKVY